ncbi:hypothetical protein PsorP6_001462 [Peronosclerospora sorghi]|uniref:Uncharacterized protein n=1 Tax=Peronosclerospora sorghi TaxID=230839 RepID=A0ACC0WWV2_9STRA|nr:hypothetical protein PsorP6_001462 [Peronosclerospora sorghi]
MLVLSPVLGVDGNEAVVDGSAPLDIPRMKFAEVRNILMFVGKKSLDSTSIGDIPIDSTTMTQLDYDKSFAVSHASEKDLRIQQKIQYAQECVQEVREEIQEIARNPHLEVWLSLSCQALKHVDWRVTTTLELVHFGSDTFASITKSERHSSK